MDKVVDSVQLAASAMSPWEVLAVVLSIAYLMLAAKEHIACWYCAFVSTAIFVVLFWDVSLLMDSGLNVYYMAMAVYGWWRWQHDAGTNDRAAIKTLSAPQHLMIVTGIGVLTIASGSLLQSHTDAAWPFVDSFTTWASVVTTVLVAHKFLENWVYWFVIDAVSVPLYIERGLHLTAGLFVVYLVIVIAGFVTWQQQYQRQQPSEVHV